MMVPSGSLSKISCENPGFSRIRMFDPSVKAARASSPTDMRVRIPLQELCEALTGSIK
jgi:hypothetical protein